MDHDQRLKNLLHHFVGPFFEAFLPDWSGRFDFSRVVWLENEVFPDPPEGKRHVLDLVAKLPLVDATGIDVGDVAEAFIALIHVEIESGDSIANFRRRQFRYYANLRQKYELPVLPVAVFLRVGLEGLGVDVYRESWGSFEAVRFAYFYVGLPKLNGVEYLESGNPAAISLMGLMKTPDAEQGRLRAEAMRKIAALVAGEQNRFILTECLDTYWELSPEQQDEYDRLMKRPEFAEAQTMTTTTFDKGIKTGFDRGVEQGFEKGIEKGIEKGRDLGRRQLLIDLIKDRFGPLPDDVLARLNSAPDGRIPALARAFAQNVPLAELLELLSGEEAVEGDGHANGK